MNGRTLRTLAALSYFVFGLHAHAAAQEGQFHDVRLVDGVNWPDALDAAPTPSADGLELFFSSERPGSRGIDIWVARRSDIASSWEVVRNVEELNTSLEEQPWWISPDGLRLYYFRAGDGGCLATRSDNDSSLAEWTDHGPIEGFGGPANFPTLTADELEIFFNDNRPAEGGNSDIWTAVRGPDRESPWGETQPVAPINTPDGSEGAPSVSPDGRMICFDQWHGGNDGDIMCATRATREESFGLARPLGRPVNTGLWEGHAHFSYDWPASGSLFYFMRGASRDSFDIYQARWEPIPGSHFLRGDCNDDGTVNISDATYILNWLFAGREPPGCIAASNTNGDDAANISDATYLLTFLFGGGPRLSAPFPDCGPGALPADKELGCANPPDCQ